MPAEAELPRKLLSIVVPAFNEEASVSVFVDAINTVFDGLELDCEIVFIDDGSQDETLASIKNSHAGSIRIRTVVLSRNFGKEIALSAGLDYAQGDAVIPMDVDMQDPPDLIPLFVEKWRAGYAAGMTRWQNAPPPGFTRPSIGSQTCAYLRMSGIFGSWTAA